MKLIYVKNFRKGFATNSSSTHSVIYRNKEDMLKDLNIFEMDYYDRFDRTIAASREAKIKYIAANIMCYDKLFEIMSALYPEMKQYEDKIRKTKELWKLNVYDGKEFGMYMRGILYFNESENLEASIDYLRNLIDNDEIVIVGGSDEADFVYETIENHEELPIPDDVDSSHYRWGNRSVIKNGNYYIGYGWDGKLRFNTDGKECIPSYPELIDLCITKKCQWNCPMCYMNANSNGQHADFESLKILINSLSSNYYERYETYREFSVGGGNVLLYPHLIELFELMNKNRHIINTTINAKDCKMIFNDEKLKNAFSKYVTGIGISVTDDSDVDILIKYSNELKSLNNKNGFITKHIVVHLIPEMLGLEKTRSITEKLSKQYYDFLFLGYKTNGRGVTQKYTTFNRQEITALFKDLYRVSIDTTFANTYKEWLDNNYETEHTVTLNEGEYSMYIDAVEGVAYKSSYQLDKPYNIKSGKYNEHLKTWWTPDEAFNEIRKDNGFKVYAE